MRTVYVVAALLFVAPPAWADDPPKLLRLTGEAPAASGAVPERFVIDATLEDGYAPLTIAIDEGWFAPLGAASSGDDGPVQGELDGSCVDGHCAFSVDHEYGKLLLTGDLLGGAAAGKFVLQDGDQKVLAQGAVRFTPFVDTVPGLGRLAAPDAVTGADLSEMLLWVGQGGGFSSVDDDPPDDFQREALAVWQGAAGRPGGGLILADDLVVLRAEVAKAKTAAGWVDLAPGVGYPGAWLKSLSASAAAGERRFASDDGKATLVIAADPPLDGDAWDAFVDKQTHDEAAGESNGYTRVNDDMEISRTKAGIVSTAAYKRTDTALHRMVLTYPEAQEERWAPMASLLQFQLRKSGK